MEKQDKTLILIITDNAAHSIRSVLSDLPEDVFDNPAFHVLVVDDCSEDGTAELASSHASDHGHGNVTVLKNGAARGYGGNQKIGFRYAVEQGFSLVVMLHGGGRYDSQVVTNFILEKKQTGASVLLGSPAYPKTSGHQALNVLQNLILGVRFSDYSTGYRAYEVEFLKQIPFELNTDGFHFDTEILLQAFALGVKISEISIPIRRGDRIYRARKLSYVWNVLKACVKYRFQRIGFFCSMQYRGLLAHELKYADKSDQYGSSHHQLLRYLRTPSRVLDLGCGPGFVARMLKDKGCYVVGADLVEPATFYGDRFIHCDLESDEMKEDVSSFDYVILSDVLEHLSDPEKLLINCRYAIKQASKSPVFIMSTGNVAFIGVRILLALGDFTYGERGILDITHKRLFTLSSFRRLLNETGYEIDSVHGIGVPFRLIFNNAFGGALMWMSYGLARLWPSLFAYQIFIEARPKRHSYMSMDGLKVLYSKTVSSVEQNPTGRQFSLADRG